MRTKTATIFRWAIGVGVAGLMAALLCGQGPSRYFKPHAAVGTRAVPDTPPTKASPPRVRKSGPAIASDRALRRQIRPDRLASPVPLLRQLLEGAPARLSVEELTPLLEEAIAQSGESDVGAQGLRLLARLGRTDVQDYVLDRLVKGVEPDYRLAAIRALGECADATYGAALLDRTRPEEARAALIAADRVARRTGDPTLRDRVVARAHETRIEIPGEFPSSTSKGERP